MTNDYYYIWPVMNHVVVVTIRCSVQKFKLIRISVASMDVIKASTVHTCWIPKCFKALIHTLNVNVLVDYFHAKPQQREVWQTHFSHINRLLIDITMGDTFLDRLNFPMLQTFMTHIGMPVVTYFCIGESICNRPIYIHSFIQYNH